MKVLITGATGFVGQNFIPDLVNKFPDIKILTINRDIEKAAKLYPFANCKHISLSDMDETKEFCPEIVYHLATLSTSRNDKEIIRPMLEANIEFGVELLEILSHCKSLKLFVNIGSFAEYRMGPQKIDDAYLYTASKSAFRTFIDYYSNLIEFKYIHLVPYTIYGGNDTAKKLIDYMYDSFNAIEPVKMTAGEQILDFIHVKDISSFFLNIIEKSNLFYQLNNGEVFHLGTGKGTKVRELAKMMEFEFGHRCNIEWGGRPYRERDTMYAVAPISKNIELLDWRTQISLKEGLKLLKDRY